MEQTSNVLVTRQEHELGLGPKWAEEYIEHSIDALQSNIEIEETAQEVKNNENPTSEYSKFMKFMTQEGDIPIENIEESLPDFHGTSKDWTEQYEADNQKSEEKVSINNNKEDRVLNKVEEEAAVAGNWIDEFQEESDAPG